MPSYTLVAWRSLAVSPIYMWSSPLLSSLLSALCSLPLSILSPPSSPLFPLSSIVSSSHAAMLNFLRVLGFLKSPLRHTSPLSSSLLEKCLTYPPSSPVSCLLFHLLHLRYCRYLRHSLCHLPSLLEFHPNLLHSVRCHYHCLSFDLSFQFESHLHFSVLQIVLMVLVG